MRTTRLVLMRGGARFGYVRKILTGYGFEQSLLIADLIDASSLPVVQRGLRWRFALLLALAGRLWKLALGRHTTTTSPASTRRP